MKHKRFWKSDLWEVSLGFGLVALMFAAAAVYNGLHGQSGEAFGDGFVAALLFGPGVFLASIDRGEAMRRVEIFAPPPQADLARAEVWKHSFLNWDNIPPDKRNPPPGTIG